MNINRDRSWQFDFASNTNSFENPSYSRSQGNSQKTPEQIAFDSELAKWEDSFFNWKRSFANHPDQSAYREYEQKFLDIHKKLMDKKRELYQPAIDFESQLLAADAMANSILSKYSSNNSRSSSLVPPLNFNNPMNSMRNNRLPSLLDGIYDYNNQQNSYQGGYSRPHSRGRSRERRNREDDDYYSREKINHMFKLARNTDYPKTLSGSGKKRLKIIKSKDQNTLTANEKYFLEYFHFIKQKRGRYYMENKKKEEAEKAAKEKMNKGGKSGATNTEERTEKMDQSEASVST